MPQGQDTAQSKRSKKLFIFLSVFGKLWLIKLPITALIAF